MNHSFILYETVEKCQKIKGPGQNDFSARGGNARFEKILDKFLLEFRISV